MDRGRDEMGNGKDDIVTDFLGPVVV